MAAAPGHVRTCMVQQLTTWSTLPLELQPLRALILVSQPRGHRQRGKLAWEQVKGDPKQRPRRAADRTQAQEEKSGAHLSTQNKTL